MNIDNIHDCFGCGVCAIACSKKIIALRLNADGFYEPYISDASKCTNCGICSEVCSYNKDDLSSSNTIVSSYAAWSNDPIIRKRCSSGGIAYEISKSIIRQGGKVCGVKYDADLSQAKHYLASNELELQATIGSKYIQSFTVDGFTELITQFRLQKSKGNVSKFLVTGTPCQIDSMRRYLRKFKIEEDFVLLDFFCHGVPSKLMWNKYLKYYTKHIGSINSVSWRNKDTGWHDSWAMSLVGENGQIMSWWSKGDIFYRLFLSDSCLGKACYDKCKYKYSNSSADIRIGDAWGSCYKKDEEGVSSLVVFTDAGYQVLSNADITTEQRQFYDISEGQIKGNPGRPHVYPIIRYCLKIDFISIKIISQILSISKRADRIIKKFGHNHN